MNFDLKKAKIFQAVAWSRNPIFYLAAKFKKLFFILVIFSFLAFLFIFVSNEFSFAKSSRLLGFSILFLILAIIFWDIESFFNLSLKLPKLKIRIKEAVNNSEKYNLAEFLSFEAARAVFDSVRYAKSKRMLAVDSSILFYFLLKKNLKLNFIFSRILLPNNEILKILNERFKNYPRQDFSGYSTDFQETLIEALKLAKDKKHQRLEIGDLISVLAKKEPTFKKILINLALKPKDIDSLVNWLEGLERRISEQKKFWEWKNLIKAGSFGKEWAAGYTITLDRFGIDLSKMMRRQGFPEMIGHRQEVESMERVLSRREINNVLIVGEPGSGRKSMVYALAEKSILGESLPEVNFKRVIQLDMTSLLAQIEDPEEVESILDKIFREVISAGNVILVIDEFHNYIGLGGVPRPGVVEISGSLAPYLHLPNFQIIGITNFEGLHRNIETNPSLLSLFEKVEVSEIPEDETLTILEDFASILERKYKIFVSYQALGEIIKLCDKYLPANPFPEQAIHILDEVMVLVSQSKEKIVLPKHISKIIFEKTQIPVGEIEAKEKGILLNLENLIHQRIVNQEEAVKEVSAALRRARAEISVRKGPMGSFLFLGPTGVGKTETSKALAEIYFKSEKRMIRLDMSEFQNISDIPRLIGSRGEEGLLITPVRENPFSLVLLDEFEKAHPNILNLFLQVFDEGSLTDGMGRKIDFHNTVIIATSNAGYQVILEALKEKTEWTSVKEKLLDYIFQQGTFRPELINRFDAVVVFRPLSKENLLDIAELLLKKIKKKLEEKEIEFLISKELKEKIVELSYDPTFGARNMERIIQDRVGNVLANAILAGYLKRGSRVEIESQEFKLKINL